MAKLRNHGGDALIGLTQWIGRKIRHHEPLAETETVSARQKQARSGSLRIGIVAAQPTTVVYTLADGRRYVIDVREASSDEALPDLVEVGA